MVIDNCGKWFECPYCREQYRDEDDALECRNECGIQHLNDIKESDRTEFICEMCGETFKKMNLAEGCESEHKKKEDKHFDNYNSINNERMLGQAASHPEQVKLK